MHRLQLRLEVHDRLAQPGGGGRSGAIALALPCGEYLHDEAQPALASL